MNALEHFIKQQLVKKKDNSKKAKDARYAARIAARIKYRYRQDLRPKKYGRISTNTPR